MNLLKNINFKSKVDYINYFDFKYWLTNESNFKLDKCTMINSIGKSSFPRLKFN